VSERESFDIHVVEPFPVKLENDDLILEIFNSRKEILRLHDDSDSRNFAKVRKEHFVGIRNLTAGVSIEQQIMRAAKYYQRFFEFEELWKRVIDSLARIKFVRSKIKEGFVNYYCGRSPKGRMFCDKVFEKFSKSELLFPFVRNYKPNVGMIRECRTDFKSLFSFGYDFVQGKPPLGYEIFVYTMGSDISLVPLFGVDKFSYMAIKRQWAPRLLYYSYCYFISDDTTLADSAVDRCARNIGYEGDCYNMAPCKVGGQCIVHGGLNCWCHAGEEFYNGEDLEAMSDVILIDNDFTTPEYYLLESYYDKQIFNMVNRLLVPWYTCNFGVVMAFIYAAVQLLGIVMTDKKLSVVKYYFDHLDYYLVDCLRVEGKQWYF